jgi:multiple sugar transport system ATP-binding protein
MADHIAVMNNGTLQQFGTPQELYERPANLFVANFIGEPPMNLLSASIVADKSGIRLMGKGWKLDLSGATAQHLIERAQTREVTVGIRPEHIKIASEAIGNSHAHGIVFYVEPRGDADVLLVDLQDASAGSPTRIVAEVSDPASLSAGHQVSLQFPPEHLSFFDLALGTNLFLE